MLNGSLKMKGVFCFGVVVVVVVVVVVATDDDEDNDDDDDDDDDDDEDSNCCDFVVGTTLVVDDFVSAAFADEFAANGGAPTSTTCVNGNTPSIALPRNLPDAQPSSNFASTSMIKPTRSVNSSGAEASYDKIA